MAFPVRESVTESNWSSPVTTHNVSMPATVNAGDLLIIAFSSHRIFHSITTPTGWTALFNGTMPNNCSGLLAIRNADGTEGGTTVNVATNNSTYAAAQCLRVSGWYEDTTYVENSSIEIASQSTSHNPPNHTLSGWGVEDTLWLAIALIGEDDATVSSYPSGYSGGTDTVSGGGGNNGATIGSAWKNSAAASENPGAFTLSSSEFGRAFTVAIRPAAAATGNRRRRVLIAGVAA